MANFCDLVNQLPAVVTNEKGKLYVNPIYLTFVLYTNHTGSIALQSDVEVSGYNGSEGVGVGHVPYLDCSVTLIEESGHVSLAVISYHKLTAAD